MTLFYKLLAKLMGLFSRKSKTELILEWNLAELSEKQEKLALQLYHYRTEDSWKLLKQVLDIAKNIQLLQTNILKTNDPVKFAHHSGRFEALTDMSNFIELAFDKEFQMQRGNEEKKKPKSVIKLKDRMTDTVF